MLPEPRRPNSPNADRSSLYLLLAIFLIALSLRVWAITVPLNVDEISWLRRGATFVREILAVDLDSTYERHHPGVTNMWLTGWAMALNCTLQQAFPQWFGLTEPFTDFEKCLRYEYYSISWFVLPRLLQALVTAATTVGITVLLRRLFGNAIALLSIGLLMFEPFFLGYQRFLTTDALMINFAALSVLWGLLYLRLPPDTTPLKFPQPPRKLTWLLASGVSMGLAAAGKITILFILPGLVAALIAIEMGRAKPSFAPRGWPQRSIEIALWTLALIATVVLLWPMLWVEPWETLQRLYEDLVDESARGHFFFLGETTDEVGLLFYPLAMLYRLSPLFQVGLLAGILRLGVPRWRKQTPYVPELTVLLGLSASMLVVFSVFSNKLDRYPLPTYPWLVVVAAVGWWSIASSLKPFKSAKVFIGGLLAVQATTLLPYAPDYVTYYNPLFGGLSAAEEIFTIGQGEGLERAAWWLNQQPQAEGMRVASWYRTVFRAYFRGEVVKIDRSRDTDTAPEWTQSNRVVLYVNQIQRKLPDPKMVNYFRRQTPLHTVNLQGIEYAWVYPGPVPTPSDLDRIISLNRPLENHSILVGREPLPGSIEPGESLEISTFWQFLARPPKNLALQLTLSDIQETKPLLGGFWFPRQIAPNSLLRDVRVLQIPETTAPGRHTLTVTLIKNGRPIGSPVTVGEIEVTKVNRAL
ncbi:ArnT family glycosyltransferase [Baaleninema sp.]|uniref:ArnT family glycosyltransferase n=1 Tax=Baaleninema sp. TaxID=3101197 RepID=UPI003D0911BA